MIKLAKAEDVEQLRQEVKTLGENSVSGSNLFGTCTDTRDTLAKTVTVDMTSQMIFESEEEMIAYKNKVHAEKVARQTY